MDEEDLYRLNETLPAGQRLAGTKIGAFLSGRNSTEKRYEAKAVLESCRKLGISVITKEDIHYDSVCVCTHLTTEDEGYK